MSVVQAEDMIAVDVSPRVTLRADFIEESYYVELAPLVPHSEMERLEDLLDRLGLEIMAEDECPAETIADRPFWLRLWCAKIDGIA